MASIWGPSYEELNNRNLIEPNGTHVKGQFAMQVTNHVLGLHDNFYKKAAEDALAEIEALRSQVPKESTAKDKAI